MIVPLAAEAVPAKKVVVLRTHGNPVGVLPVVQPGGGKLAASNPCASRLVAVTPALPSTWSLFAGDRVPIPRFPAESSRMRSLPLVLKTSDFASVVPRKFVPDVVPALPPSFQKAPASSPSTLSAFRFGTIALEFTESGGLPALTIACRPGPPPVLTPRTPGAAAEAP